MILNSQAKQLRLQDDGQILWQADASNPLPGNPVARIRKGAGQLSPDIDLLETDILQGQDRDAVSVFIKTWLDQHIATVLEKLMALTREEGMTGPAREIGLKIHDALGILPRQDLESLIAGLDPEARKALRQNHIRLGPVLVFVPDLNKPAAVRLRALLWWLWKDRPLPAPVPKDGAVSVVVDETQIDPLYYRAIGYPVYGGRAVRVDMLDRVISAVYDSAKDGSFKATHAMAEWLGCSIPDLYKVLEAMGHKKSFDPADQPVAEPAIPAMVPEEVSAAPEAADKPAEAEAPAPAPEPVPAKPELATFRLKRGKANQSERPPREFRSKPAPRAERDKKPDRPSRPRDKKGRSDRDREEKKPISFEARPSRVEDSPFAILQQMRSGMQDK
jgi:ATP-dependent RNA helicase SUPV3L1/SUV3